MSKKTWLVIGIIIIAVAVICSLAKEKPAQTSKTSTQNSYSGTTAGGDYSASYYINLAEQYEQKAIDAQKDVEFAEEQLQNAITNQRGIIVCQNNVDSAKQLKEKYEQLAEQYRALAQQAGN